MQSACTSSKPESVTSAHARVCQGGKTAIKLAVLGAATLAISPTTYDLIVAMYPAWISNPWWGLRSWRMIRVSLSENLCPLLRQQANPALSGLCCRERENDIFDIPRLGGPFSGRHESPSSRVPWLIKLCLSLMGLFMCHSKSSGFLHKIPNRSKPTTITTSVSFFTIFFPPPPPRSFPGPVHTPQRVRPPPNPPFPRPRTQRR